MKFSNRLIFFIIFVLAATLTAAYFFPVQGSSVTLSAYIASICGNGTQELTEQCDGSDLNGQTCAGLGYDSGALSCGANCAFNASACAAAPAPSGGGGGGGGSGVIYTPPATGVTLQGKAYPNAPLTVLKDGQVAAITKADSFGDFKIQLTTITAGAYTFGIWAEDKDGVKSVTFSFTVTVIAGTVTTISGIFIPPTINLSQQNVSRGEILDIYGQTAPQSNVDVHIYSDEIVKKAEADKNGSWNYSLNTTDLNEGAHTTKAKSDSNGLISTFSQTLSFYIGRGIPGAICQWANLNGDGRVNLVDFSILLYWWGRANDCADQNKNGVVDLADFSVMMYYWTG